LQNATSIGATSLAQAILSLVPGTTKDCMSIAFLSSLAGQPFGLVSSLILAIISYYTIPQDCA
jgi:ABC-type antimicrobial peptide transport system permease subunit